MSETAETAEKPAVEKTIEEAKTVEAKPKKKKGKGIYMHYEIEDGKLKRTLPFCERCGPGYFMADHGDRYTCGHCGFTRYKPAETSK